MTLFPNTAYKWLGGLLRCALVAVILAWIPLTVEAQFTVEMFIKSMVDDAGNAKYGDIQQALDKASKGDFNGARESFREAKQKNPELAPAEMMLARLLYAAKQQKLGRRALERAVNDEPNDPESYLVMGELALQQQLVTDADLLFKKASSLCASYSQNPKRKKNMASRAYGGLASVARSRQKWALAKSNLEAWRKNDPQDANAHDQLGRVIFQIAETSTDKTAQKELHFTAFTALKKAYDLDNTKPRYEISMAFLYDSVKKRKNAAQLMKRAMERDGDNLKTRLMVGHWALGAGDSEMAQKNADAALKIDPNNLQARLFSGLTARYRGNSALAEKHFSEALQKTPGDFDATNQLALSLIEQQDTSKRTLALQHAITNQKAYSNGRDKRGREAAITLAWIQFTLGQDTQAEEYIKKVLQTRLPISAESSYYVAKVLAERNQIAAAQKILERVLEGILFFPHRQDAEALFKKLAANNPG